MVIAPIQPSTFSPFTVSVFALVSTCSTLPRNTCSTFGFAAAADGDCGAGDCSVRVAGAGSVLAVSRHATESARVMPSAVAKNLRVIPAVYRDLQKLLKCRPAEGGHHVRLNGESRRSTGAPSVAHSVERECPCHRRSRAAH